MFERIFPQSFDNHYYGHTLAVWLLLPILMMRCVVALAPLFEQSANPQPWSSNSAEQAMALQIVLQHADLAASQLLIWAFGLLVLVRYRAMLPLLYTLMVFEACLQNWIVALQALNGSAANSLNGSAPGSLSDSILLLMTLFGFVLSLYRAPSCADPQRRSLGPYRSHNTER